MTNRDIIKSFNNESLLLLIELRLTFLQLVMQTVKLTTRRMLSSARISMSTMVLLTILRLTRLSALPMSMVILVAIMRLLTTSMTSLT